MLVAYIAFRLLGLLLVLETTNARPMSATLPKREWTEDAPNGPSDNMPSTALRRNDDFSGSLQATLLLDF